MKKKLNKEAELQKKLEKGFLDFFGNLEGTKTFISPSSIIILGDHTQYNDGIMISTTVDSYVGFCIRKTEENFTIVVDDKKYSADDLTELKFNSDQHILSGLENLLKNIAESEYEIDGFECCIINDTSKVFGLGNFAAMNVGFLKALESVSSLNFTNQELIDFVLESDRELYGAVLSKPIYYSVLGQRENTLMYYDTRSDYRKFFTISDKYKLSICNTNILKDHFREICQERIQECEVGVKGLRLYIWGIKNLRDVEEKFLERHVHMLPKRLYMRCLYNVHTRKLVEEAYKDLRYDKIEQFGEKIFETQRLLNEEYEISSPTMDKLVKFAEESGVVLGSKMVSCSHHDSTLNLVANKDVSKFEDYITKHYSTSNGSNFSVKEFSVVGGFKELKKKEKAVQN